MLALSAPQLGFLCVYPYIYPSWWTNTLKFISPSWMHFNPNLWWWSTNLQDSEFHLIVQLYNPVCLVVMWQPSLQDPPPLHVAYSVFPPDLLRVEVFISIAVATHEQRKKKNIMKTSMSKSIHHHEVSRFL